MAMGDFGTELTNANGAVPLIFSKRVALAFGQKGMGVTDNLTNNNWEGDIKGQGDRVRIVLPVPPAEGAIAFGNSAEVCPTFKSVAPEALDLIVNKVATYGLAIDDVQKAQTQFKEWLAAQANVYGQELASERNKEIADYILKYNEATPADNDSAAYTPGNHTFAGTYGTPDAAYAKTIDASNIFEFMLQIKEDLIEKGAIGEDGTYSFAPLEEEMREERAVICVTPRMHSLMLASYRVGGRSVEMADVVVKDGAVTRIAGLDIVIDKTLDRVKSTNTKTLKEQNLMAFIAGTKNAVTKAEQLNKVESSRDPRCFRDLVKGLALYGYKMVHPECIVRGVIARPEFDAFNAGVPVKVINKTTDPVNTKEVQA